MPDVALLRSIVPLGIYCIKWQAFLKDLMIHLTNTFAPLTIRKPSIQYTVRIFSFPNPVPLSLLVHRLPGLDMQFCVIFVVLAAYACLASAAGAGV